MSFAGTEAQKKPSCFDRLKCCGKNKVADKTPGRCPRASKKEWARRAESVLGEPVKPPRFVKNHASNLDKLKRIESDVQ